MTTPPSARTTLRRGANRAEYDADTIREILRVGMIAHVGIVTDDGPLVLPMAYGLGDDVIYLHGAVANAMLRGADGVEVCVTVTLLDGLVVARSPFHDSMNYRSVVIRGRAHTVEDPDERWRALRSVTDHVVAHFDLVRPPSQEDLRRTRVLAVPLAEASAKIRTGDPVDDPADVAGPHWAGSVPVVTTFGAPVASADLANGAKPHDSVAALEGTGPDDRVT